MNVSELSLDLLTQLGGIENIKSVSNCQTRIRVELVDKELANVEEIKKLDGIIGLIPFGSQYQVVLGPRTQEVADIYINKLKIQNANK